MRLDKYLSDATSHSRRDVRILLRRKQITVNGKIARTPDESVCVEDDVRIDDEPVRYRQYVYLMMNKPQGYLSATEDKHDPVVTELVPDSLKHFNAFPVGRLDKDTEGLLLLTNDGQFDHALMSPRKNIRKRYLAFLDAPAQPSDIDAFRAGMTFKEFTAQPAELEISDDPCHVQIVISEGKYHQVKRMCERVGKQVVFLKRIAIGDLHLDDTLPPGGVRELTTAELELLIPGMTT